MTKRITIDKILLFIIVIFGFYIRYYRVSEIPPSLSWDEVSIGYNAYSILKTGKDEHGKFLPLNTFAAYGDYKPPLSIYLTVPSIALFGLNEFGVRFPVVILSTLSIPLIYLLTKELFQKIRNSKFEIRKLNITDNIVQTLNFPTIIALTSAMLLSISPWHIQLSRAGFEATIAFTLLLLGMTLILVSRHNAKLFVFSFLPFVAAIYTFNSARYSGPFIALSLIIYMWKDIKIYKRELFYGIIIAGITLLPIIPHLLSPESRLRFKEVSIFNNQYVILDSNKRIHEGGNSVLSNILHNRRVGYAKLFVESFLNNVRPDFLFTRGDGNPKFSTQETGQLYLIEAPLLAIGFISLLFSYSSQTLLLFVIGLFAIAPAGFAVETPHALRTLNALPVFLISISYGITIVLEKCKSFKYHSISNILLLVFFGSYLFSFLHFSHQYFVHSATEYSGEWQYGYKQAIQYAHKHFSDYDSIVITESIGRPWTYIAFYTEYNPEQYRKDIVGTFDAAGFYNVSKLGKWIISREGRLSPEGRTLYILDLKDVPDGADIKETVKLLNGDKKLVVFE